MKCEILAFDAVDWHSLDQLPDRTVFQTREWLRFLAQTQNATPVVAELREGGEIFGYFSGLTFSRFGIKILGSSFPGWTTPYVGFNLLAGASRRAALAAVEKMAWSQLNCLHVEISDPNLTIEDGEALGFSTEFYDSYRTDLSKSEEDLFNTMNSACRRCVRKAEKSGVTIEEACDPAFADEYYAQLESVFARQGLVPTYKLDRVRALIENLQPTGRLLLLRARDAQRNCIATGIFPGYNKIAEFWGNASLRSGQILRPNELMHWHVMRFWKSRGALIYDWGGGGDYKEKYGCTPHRVPWLVKSRYQFVSRLRGQARKMFAQRQRLLGWLQAERHDREPQNVDGPIS